MSNSIWKTPIELPEKYESQIVVLPVGAIPLKLDFQHGRPTVWWIVNVDAKEEYRRLRWVSTGQVGRAISKEAYIGMVYDGPYVWHLFDEKI